ncbi:hypothetical protein PAXRUDRAFT_24681 [Paxillus rubicundulus Ve08.2h10]|uniref:Uncharacterized protein n=1 Tax=Paxillus rubicundulus Ve08.2h10 TaxID=930991 RepID=A0A0D0EBB8_9AGAM|nr:hypothetical protein PAXRUDRAFT_24681 [Paxillus rubicundulus Ve08.2h10]
MFGRQPVKITYTHKRKRLHGSSRMQSSPLDILPPDKGDLTHSEMTRRMLKRSRRAALIEQVQGRNIDHDLTRERLVKRFKHADERTVNGELIAESLNMSLPQHDLSLQTPFPASEYIHESAVAKPLIPEQLSPVPVGKRINSRTSSRNLKENGTHSQTLASPFHSRPGSAASSPRRQGRERSLRASRSSLHAKSRTLSATFKENPRRISRKDSTVSLNDNKMHSRGPAKHQRYPSTPSTSYMRSQFAQQDWLAPPKAISRTFDEYNGGLSPHGSVHSITSFLHDGPQSCSTPAVSRPRRLASMQAPTSANEPHAPLAQRADLPHSNATDIEMIDDRQTVHISRNSIFPSSGEFTIGLVPATNTGATPMDADSLLSSTGKNLPVTRASDQAANRPPEINVPQPGRNLARTFPGEYFIPLPSSGSPPVSAAKADGTIIVPNRPKVAVGKHALALPTASSPAPEGAFIDAHSFHPAFETLTPPASPYRTRGSLPPSSPAGDLAQEMRSLGLGGDMGTRSDREAPQVLSGAIQTRSHSLDSPASIVAATSAKKTLPTHKPARNRAGTIRASDYAKPGPSSTTAAVASLPGARRTRSGTVVGPNSKLAKDPALASRVAMRTPAAELPVVGFDSESDDELLLKGPWIEDLVYLGLPVPTHMGEAEADEMNLGGLWHGEEWGRPPRRLGLRRR